MICQVPTCAGTNIWGFTTVTAHLAPPSGSSAAKASAPLNLRAAISPSGLEPVTTEVPEDSLCTTTGLTVG